MLKMFRKQTIRNKKVRKGIVSFSTRKLTELWKSVGKSERGKFLGDEEIFKWKYLVTFD